MHALLGGGGNLAVFPVMAKNGMSLLNFHKYYKLTQDVQD